MDAGTTEIIPKEERLIVISFKGVAIPSNYQNVVLSRWLNSLRKLNRFFKIIDNASYYRAYEEYIKAILRRPDVVVRFAVLESDKDVVFGWSVYENDILHYVHIADPYKRKGISRDLIPKNINLTTHITEPWERLFLKRDGSKYKHVKFNPFVY